MAVIKFEAGAKIQVNGDDCEILRILNTDEILVLNKGSGNQEIVAREDVRGRSGTGKSQPICSIDPRNMDIARERFRIIEPLLTVSGSIQKLLVKIAKTEDKSPQTIRNWLNLYENSPILSSLVPRRRNSQKGQKRLSSELETIIEHVIRTKYLTKQKLTKKKTYQQVKMACREAGLKAPSQATVSRRIDLLSDEEKTRKRRGPKQAKDKYKEINAQYGDAKRPLEVVQIDHTQLNVMVVDSEDRECIGRPWITVAIDVFSRVITGMFISLDPPSADSVGMCLCQSILEKDAFLRQIGVEGSWPVWGRMVALHMDNGKDFRGEMVRIFAEEWSVNVQFRPPGFAEWGGHIERLNGTLKTELDSVKGTTFRGPKDRVEYDPEKHAVMTLDELEQYLFNHVVNVYHQEKHSQLGCPPIAKWQDGLLGENGSGLPNKVEDTEKLRLDLLPMSKRKIRRDGIVWDHIHYSCPELKLLLINKDKFNMEKLIVRRDPRDISTIYLYHPVLKSYIPVPYRDTFRQPISLWEHRDALARLKSQGITAVNENLIFDALEKNQRLVEASEKTTKSIRKNKEKARRRKQDAKRVPATPKKTAENQVPKPELKPVPPVEVKVPDPPDEDDFIDFDEEQLKPQYMPVRRIQ